MTGTNVARDQTNSQTDFHTMTVPTSPSIALRAQESANRSRPKLSLSTKCSSTKSAEQAQTDCDFIALYGWPWWKQVVADAEAKVKANTSREEN